MRMRVVGLTVLGCLVAMAALLPRPAAAPVSGPLAVSTTATSAASSDAKTQPVLWKTQPNPDPNREIYALGRRAPRYRAEVHRALAETDDLYAFVVEWLPKASSGDGASQYDLYLALDECQAYLVMRPDELPAVYNDMQLVLSQAPVEERLGWQQEYQRCHRFAGADLRPIEAALGPDKPGSEREYGSAWFERALASGYPAALAEQALRDPELDARQRREQLAAAAGTGDPEVYWELSRYLADEQGSLAWLILACRAGYDCRAQASWYRAGVCAQAEVDCRPAESAVEHYWYAMPAAQHDAAYLEAARIDALLRAGEWRNLPWGSLVEAVPD